MRRPNYIEGLDADGYPFDKLNDLYYNGKTYTDLMELEKDAGSQLDFRGLDVFNSRNPLLMNTYIAPPGSYFYGIGMKKGGKLIPKRN